MLALGKEIKDTHPSDKDCLHAWIQGSNDFQTGLLQLMLAITIQKSPLGIHQPQRFPDWSKPPNECFFQVYLFLPFFKRPSSLDRDKLDSLAEMAWKFRDSERGRVGLSLQHLTIRIRSYSRYAEFDKKTFISKQLGRSFSSPAGEAVALRCIRTVHKGAVVAFRNLTRELYGIGFTPNCSFDSKEGSSMAKHERWWYNFTFSEISDLVKEEIQKLPQVLDEHLPVSLAKESFYADAISMPSSTALQAAMEVKGKYSVQKGPCPLIDIHLADTWPDDYNDGNIHAFPMQSHRAFHQWILAMFISMRRMVYDFNDEAREASKVMFPKKRAGAPQLTAGVRHHS